MRAALHRLRKSHTAIPGCAPKSYATASFTSTRIPAIFFTNSSGIP
jgi:hypothetical protein